MHIKTSTLHSTPTCSSSSGHSINLNQFIYGETVQIKIKWNAKNAIERRLRWRYQASKMKYDRRVHRSARETKKCETNDNSTTILDNFDKCVQSWIYGFSTAVKVLLIFFSLNFYYGYRSLSSHNVFALFIFLQIFSIEQTRSNWIFLLLFIVDSQQSQLSARSLASHAIKFFDFYSARLLLFIEMDFNRTEFCALCYLISVSRSPLGHFWHSNAKEIGILRSHLN